MSIKKNKYFRLISLTKNQRLKAFKLFFIIIIFFIKSGFLIIARKTHINVIPNTNNKYAKPKIIIFNKITFNFILS